MTAGQEHLKEERRNAGNSKRWSIKMMAKLDAH
jgi:hypothetical protein